MQFLLDATEIKNVRPMLSVDGVAVGADVIADVSKLLTREGIACSANLGDDEILLADDPGGEVLDYYVLWRANSASR